MKQFKKIYVEITNRCNLHCSFCGNTKRPLKEMSVEEFSLVLKKIKKYTDYVYLHVKGEPLLHSSLPALLNLCEENGIAVNITTNGVLLDKYLDVFLKANCLRQINVSLHCEQNVTDYFAKVFSTCQKLSSKTFISYRFWTLKNGQFDKKSTAVVDKIIAFYDLSTEIVDKIKNDKNIKIANNTYIAKEDIFVWPDTNHQLSSDGYCHALSKHVAILVDGTVIPCCLDGEGIINLGNIFIDDLGDILDDERSRKMLLGFRNNKSVEELCKNCTFKNRFNG